MTSCESDRRVVLLNNVHFPVASIPTFLIDLDTFTSRLS